MRWSCVLLALLMVGCTQPPPEEPGTVLVARSPTPGAPATDEGPLRGNVSFDTLAQGVQSGIHRDGLHIEPVLDQQAWQDLWSEHAPDRDAPKVDFTTRFVVAVFMGDQDSTGHHIEVTALRATERGVYVETRGVSPQDECVIGPATQPHHFVEASRERLDPLQVRPGNAVWDVRDCPE